MSPLGVQPASHKPNLVGADLDTRLSLLEECVWRCVAHVHACSKRVAQVGCLLYVYILNSYIILQVKNKPHLKVQ
jgi:hypothetical protein